jgi:hypothetical protein
MKRIHNRLLCRGLASLIAVFLFTAGLNAAELRVPPTVQAGQAFTISVQGSGQATFYLVGPESVLKRNVVLGNDLQIQAGDVRGAGQYRAIICDSSCTATTFEVKAAEPAHLSFFLHPSRVPVSSRGSIDASAYVFDQYFNLVLSPTEVDFRIAPVGGAGTIQKVSTKNGVTWMHLDSTAHEGLVRVTAALADQPDSHQAGKAEKIEEVRAIQQVAAEACALRMKNWASGDKVTVETDPVRDCSGNTLPDGTVVSFTMLDKSGKSTVDTPIKKGIARTQFSVHGPAQISVACGVVLGNDVTVNGNL